ncbi:MAG: glycosyltransferase family 39 protein [Thermodesulfovibrionales bacterium]
MVGLFVVFIAWLVYINSLGNGFVWDDAKVILNNPVLQDGPLLLFSSVDTVSDAVLSPYYRPITYLTFLIEGRLHGFTPFLVRFFNVLLHSINAFLVYKIALSLYKGKYTALLAGLLFAVHPLNTESVDFNSGGRNTMLACFFILLAYLFHRRSIIQQSISGAFAGGVFFLAGLFSKETAMAVLPFIIALEIAPFRDNATHSRLKALGRLLPYAAATLCYLFMRWMTLSKLGVQTNIIPGLGIQKMQDMYNIPNFSTRLLDNLYIIPRYFLTVIMPTSLSPVYVVPDDLNLIALPLAAAWICIIGIFIWLFTRGRSQATIWGMSWLIAFWLPVSGIIYFPSASLADRYLYLPAIGLWLVIADQAVRLLPADKRARKYGVVAAMLVLLILSSLTVRRNLDWKNEIALFTQVVDQYPDDARGHASLGGAYYKERSHDGRYLTLAEQEYEKALTLDPALQMVHTPLGSIRMMRGDYAGAVYHYTHALGIYPLDKEALINRGIALEKIGRQKEAIRDYRIFLSAPGKEFAEMRPYAEERLLEISR